MFFNKKLFGMVLKLGIYIVKKERTNVKNYNNFIIGQKGNGFMVNLKNFLDLTAYQVFLFTHCVLSINNGSLLFIQHLPKYTTKPSVEGRHDNDKGPKRKGAISDFFIEWFGTWMNLYYLMVGYLNTWGLLIFMAIMNYLFLPFNGEILRFYFSLGYSLLLYPHYLLAFLFVERFLFFYPREIEDPYITGRRGLLVLNLFFLFFTWAIKHSLFGWTPW